MSLTNDIPTKLRVPAQLALDAKTVVTSLSQLQTLGTNNNLAYTYYKGMEVLCSEDLGIYRWRPVNEGETGGTLASNFTYPAGIVSEDGVVYSNIAYNFFKETTITVENLVELVQIRNVGTGTGIYKDTITVAGVRYFNLKSLTSTGNSITITQEADTINLEVDIDPTVFLEDGVTTTISGDGVTTPYSVEIENLQKIITSNYTLTDNDDKHTIFIENGVNNILITVPKGLKDNFYCAFYQLGDGNVQIASDVSLGSPLIFTPIGNFIKGKYYWAHLEKVMGREEYGLLATVKL